MPLLFDKTYLDVFLVITVSSHDWYRPASLKRHNYHVNRQPFPAASLLLSPAPNKACLLIRQSGRLPNYRASSENV